MNEPLYLNKLKSKIEGSISICGSKSENNRLLILNQLFGNPIQLENSSDSEDSQLLKKALNSDSDEIDIHHAGTAMRFLTAYYSIQEGRTVTLTGSERMKQRPIGILVEALRNLGAEIEYLEKSGFPPLKIHGKTIEKDFVELDANVSSQFITALMLIAPKLKNGLTIQLNGKITSLPYLKMSAALLEKFGIPVELGQNQISIQPKSKINNQIHSVESDWSSASYYYSLVALSDSKEIILSTYNENSLQGDAEVANIYKKYFGIETKFEGNKISLSKNIDFEYSHFEIDLNSTPDIAQTIAVTAAGLKIKCKLNGLETLKIKETDRLQALQNELKKVGTNCTITKDSLEITDFFKVTETPIIQTYNDHRMAMSFAPLCSMMDFKIENPEVVNKSYPAFWKDLQKMMG